MSKRQPIKKKTFFYLFPLLTYSAMHYAQICWKRHHAASVECPNQLNFVVCLYGESNNTVKITVLKLGKSCPTLIHQYQIESDGSESESHQRCMKSISKPGSFGVKTEPTLLDTFFLQISKLGSFGVKTEPTLLLDTFFFSNFSILSHRQYFVITFPLELRNQRPKAIQT